MHNDARNALRALALPNGGLFSPAQARDTGVSQHALTRMLRSGEIERLYRSVYRYAVTPMDEWARGMAGLMSLGDRAALSHGWAGAVHGIRGFPYPDLPVLSTTTRARPRAGLVIHIVDRLDRCDLTVVDGLRVTSGARTVIDTAHRPLAAVTQTVDEVICARLASRRSLHRRAEALDDGSAGLRRIIDITKPGAEGEFHSWLERTAGEEMARRQLPLPRWQVPVYDEDGYVGCVDGLYEDTPVIIEWEGLRFHTTPSQRRKDAARFTRLVTARYMPLRFGWLDVTENFDEVERQIRKALRLPRPRR
jgi:hypothetical protein